MTKNENVLRFYITGRVQGVGFRRWAVREATNLHLTGWVRNRYDGRVEIYVKGKKEELQVFVNLCKKGPLFSKVLSLDFNVDQSDEPPIKEGFFIQQNDF